MIRAYARFFLLPMTGALLFVSGINCNSSPITLSLFIISMGSFFLSYPYYKGFTPESCFAAITWFLRFSAFLIFIYGAGIGRQLINNPGQEMFLLPVCFIISLSFYRLALHRSHYRIFHNKPNAPVIPPVSKVIPAIISVLVLFQLCKFSDVMYFSAPARKTQPEGFVTIMKIIFFTAMPVAFSGLFYLWLCRIAGLKDSRKTPQSPHAVPDRLS